MQTNPAVEQNKNVKWRVRLISPVGEEKIYGGSHVLSSKWKAKRPTEDESGDSEDGEDDELPCVIGGESEGDCIRRGYNTITIQVY